MADAAPAAKRGCFKRSCLGCLAVFGAGLAILMVLALITLIRGEPEVVPENLQRAHSVPEGDWDLARSGTPLVIDEGQVGRVVLDVSMARFSIVPEPPGTPVRLDARFDSGSYELEESMQASGELGWTYRVSFGRRSAFDFIHMDAADNRLELHLPSGTPLVLEGQVGIGESDIQLGGLWIESVDLEAGIGDHRIDFNEPLAFPMSSFKLNGSIGETRVTSLGNASPAEVTVRHRIGDIRVDLDGDWRNDSMVTVSSSIGACRVSLPPESIAFELLGARVTLGETNVRRASERPDPPTGAPVVRLRASNGLGEMFLTK